MLTEFVLFLTQLTPKIKGVEGGIMACVPNVLYGGILDLMEVVFQLMIFVGIGKIMGNVWNVIMDIRAKMENVSETLIVLYHLLILCVQNGVTNFALNVLLERSLI